MIVNAFSATAPTTDLEVTLEDGAWQGVDAGVEALVDSWLVQPGARVAAGQTLVKVVLVKSTLDVPAPSAGTLERILVAAGETFARGQALGVLRRA